MADQRDDKERGRRRGLIALGVLVVVLIAIGMATAERAEEAGGATAPGQSELQAASLPDFLSAEEQAARSQACQERMRAFMDLGVWKHGGARPGVDADAWELLSESEQDELFRVAACIAAGGQVGERIVTVEDATYGGEIDTRRVANDQAF